MTKGKLSSSYGQIDISPDVIAYYAGSQAVGCFGIVGMASISMADGIAHLLGKNSLGKGIQIHITENRITIDFHVIVSYGVNICSVADNLIENVKYKIEEFTGLEVEKINIFVEGVRVID